MIGNTILRSVGAGSLLCLHCIHHSIGAAATVMWGEGKTFPLPPVRIAAAPVGHQPYLVLCCSSWTGVEIWHTSLLPPCLPWVWHPPTLHCLRTPPSSCPRPPQTSMSTGQRGPVTTEAGFRTAQMCFMVHLRLCWPSTRGLTLAKSSLWIVLLVIIVVIIFFFAWKKWVKGEDNWLTANV